MDELKKLFKVVKETFQGWILFNLLILAVIIIGLTYLDWFRVYFVENLGETVQVTLGIIFWVVIFFTAFVLKSLWNQRREKKLKEKIKQELGREKQEEMQVILFKESPKKPNNNE